ncbi:fungal-specific transcription factor domain-containing protein [Xylariaceae sp. FL1651]|nr:fungal-specific transcription factor domain-containing protein [Xylariaceae sp. FL1651]
MASRLDWYWNGRATGLETPANCSSSAFSSSSSHTSGAVPASTVSPSRPAAAKSHGRSKAPSGRLACDVCRDRKVRCDREWPRCGRCARIGDVCGYRGRAQRTSQSDLARQLRGLQDQQAQAQISTQRHPAGAVATGFPGSTVQHPPTTPDPPHHATSKGLTMQSPGLELDVGFLPDLSGDAFDLQNVSLECPSAVEYAHENASLAASKEPWEVEFRLSSIGPMDGVPQAEQAPMLESPPTNPEPPSTIGSLQGDQLSPEVLGELHAKFFELLFPTMPILIESQFFSLIRENLDAPQFQALSYAVALVGAMVSPEHQNLEIPCLNMARKYVEICEQDDETMMSLELFQALLCIVRYELTHKKIMRAWITVGRTVRLATILGLHLSNPEAEGSEVHRGLPPTTDPLLLEQRRRSFWALYICETYASSRARLPPLLQEDHISAPLPSPGTLDLDFSPSTSLTLRETYDTQKISGCSISAFAGVVLACAISRRCQPHAEAVTMTPPSSSSIESPRTSSLIGPMSTTSGPPTKSFWDRHFSLLTVLRHRIDLLGPHLTVRAVQKDVVSFALYVYLCGIDVALQEAAVVQAKRQEFSPIVAADSERRSRTAAYRLVGVAQGMLFNGRSSEGFFAIHGAFISRPLAVAIQVLGRDLSRHSDEPHAASKVVFSLHMLLGALDQTEEEEGFWHQMVEPVIRALREWEDVNSNRPADIWGTAPV